MVITSYLTVGLNIVVIDETEDSPLANLQFANEAHRDLDEDAKLRIGERLQESIADELRKVYESK